MGFVEDVHRGRVAASHASRLASTEVGHRYISHLRATPPDFIYLVGAHGSKSNKKKNRSLNHVPFILPVHPHLSFCFLFFFFSQPGRCFFLGWTGFPRFFQTAAEKSLVLGLRYIVIHSSIPSLYTGAPKRGSVTGKAFHQQ